MKKNNKGSMLIMSAILLSVIVMIGSTIIVLFFKGYIKVAQEINYQHQLINIQVEAQELYSTFDKENLPIEPIKIEYDIINKIYSYTLENKLFKIDVELNEDLQIIKWQIKEK